MRLRFPLPFILITLRKLPSLPMLQILPFHFIDKTIESIELNSNYRFIIQMINAFAIQNDQRVIEQYITSSTPEKRIEKIIKMIQKKSKGQSRLTIKFASNDYTAFYFAQDSFRFIIITQEWQKEVRIKRYLNTIAEIFYDEYDERTFHKVLKYAVDEINRTEASVADNHLEVTMSDQNQSDILLKNSAVENRRKIKQSMERGVMVKGRRARVITILLILAIMVLLVLYYGRRE